MECFENDEARTANYSESTTEATKLLNSSANNRAVLKELNSNNESKVVSQMHAYIKQGVITIYIIHIYKHIYIYTIYKC